MPRLRIFVTGTDTDVGKTVFASALAGALQASYWKPVQAGSLERTDSDTVRALSGLPQDKILPEGHRLAAPCSPHRSAELDRTRIDTDTLCPPEVDPLVVEGAGGLMVPLTRKILLIDLVASWRLPAVIVARTSLGTINHSLLSIHALRSWKIPLLGIAFVGEPNSDSEEVICGFGKAKRLGRLARVEPLDRSSLKQAFAASFQLDDFR